MPLSPSATCPRALRTVRTVRPRWPAGVAPALALALSLLLLTAGAAAATADCPAPPRRWVERPLPADCLACWQTVERLPRGTLALDWIVPTTPEAPLAVAALPEAAERFAALTGRRQQVLPSPPAGVGLAVDSGLAWHGYVALTFELRRPIRTSLPAGARGWVALVERVAAGQDGSGSDRRLVRALAGPLTLDAPATGEPLQHVLAVRLPENAQTDRLGAVGWIERADGRLWLAVESPRPGCGPTRP